VHKKKHKYSAVVVCHALQTSSYVLETLASNT